MVHYYAFNISDFNNSTRHLTRVERSVYREAIDYYYDTEQPFPCVEFDKLARRLMCNSEEERVALQAILDEFFEVKDGHWHQSRCDAEIAAYRENTEAKRRAGQASARARQQKRNKRSTEFNTCSTDEQLTNNYKPRTNNQSNRAFKPPSVKEVAEYCEERGNGIDADAFVDFYATNGWVQGKGRKPVKDWKACVRTWEKERKPANQQTQGLEL